MSRQAISCIRCRQQKVRCDRVWPRCSRCASCKATCSFSQHSEPETSGSASALPTSTPVGSNSASQDFSPCLPPSPLPGLGHDCSPAPSNEHRVDPEPDGKVKRKRRRACLSCVRCHRLKIKCDKKEPCARCRLSGWGKHCEYTHRIEARSPSSSSPPSPPYVLTDEDPQVALATWHSRHRGLSHWRNLLSKVILMATVSLVST
jgi:hypothetical protein